MAGSIKVDPAILKSTAGKIDAQAAEYRKQFAQLYTEVNNMKSAWQGADNQAFTTQIEGFKPEFEKMAKLMDEYSQFLKMRRVPTRKPKTTSRLRQVSCKSVPFTNTYQ